MNAIVDTSSTTTRRKVIYSGLQNRFYDKEAPTNVGAKQIPSFVRMRCTLFVTGLIHAASLVSSVVNPEFNVSKVEQI